MKLWLLLVAFGDIGATWGPLPYDMAACHSRAAEMIAEIHAGMAANPHVRLDGAVIMPADINAYCVEAEDRPELGSAFQP
ncbi:hypothetical protein [Devosia sp. 2618]|uniref:hypothetical protein n=1 Tax=Devosia sp. 2618 TaxID=3156454 RepID=UPI003393B5ED